MLLTAPSPVDRVEPSGGRERFFRGRGDRGEALLIEHRDVREDLAVDFDLRAAEAVHEPAIRQAVRACGRVDSRDPERAELALAHPTVAERVLARLDDSLLRGAIDLAPRVVVTLGLV